MIESIDSRNQSLIRLEFFLGYSTGGEKRSHKVSQLGYESPSLSYVSTELCFNCNNEEVERFSQL